MFSLKAQAPPWQWAKAAHTVASEYATDVAFDPSGGNMISVGVFNSDLSAFFGPKFIGAVGGGYVAKYDPLGNIIWAFPIGNNQDDACNGVTVDLSGNIYVTGYLQQIADFKGMGTVSTILTSVGGKDIFTAKYNSSGQLLWVTQAGGATDDEGTSVCVTANGVYITGYYTGTANFGAVQLLVLSGSDDKAYTAAYDVNGNSLWATSIGNSGSEAFGTDICADNANVFVTGKFTGASVNIYDAGLLSILSLLFPSATLTNSSASSYDGFTASFTASGGLYNWAGLIHSSSNDYNNGITQAGNNLYITGATGSSASFPGYASNPVAVSASGLDLFVAQLNKSNGNTAWVKSEPGNNDQQGMSISIDTFNLITLAGYFDGGINFTGGSSITSSGNEDVFVAAYNTAGTFQWVTQAGDNGTDIAHAVSTGNLGEIYVAGEYENNAVFGANILTQDSPPNIFAAKLACPPIVNNIISSSQIVCITQTPAAIAGSSPLGSSGTFSYLWQQSPDNLTWTPASGTNNVQNYTPPLLTSNTYYQRVVTATGGCSNISASNSVLITINQLPTAAVAGSDQIICANSATLTANTPSVGIGAWTVYAGSGNILSPANSTSTVNGLNPGLNGFVWTISNGACPPSADTLKINVDAQPTPANAGNNQFLCLNTSTTLAGNIPAIGTGIWTVLSGTSTIVSPATGTTSVNGLSLGQNAFVWTISNGSCLSSKDTVLVQVNENPSPAVVASNQTICASTSTLSAVTPAVGTGTWSLLSGTGIMTSPATNTTSVSGLSIGQNSFVWTVSSGACTSSSATLTIQVDAPPSIAGGITNQNICASSTLLAANNPTVGSGTWTNVSGAGVISSVHSNTTSVNSLNIGQNLFLWTVTNGVCPASSDTFKVKVDAVPSPATAGGDQTICSSSSVLSATVPAIGNGTWHVLTGSSTLLSPTTNSTSVMGLTVGSNSFEWVVSNGVCPVNIDTVIVTVNAPPSAANAGSDKGICTSSYTLNAVAPVIGNGNWNVLYGGTANVTTPALSNSAATGLSLGFNSFEWVVSNGVCPVNRDTVVITVYALPNISVTGNTVICNGSSTILTASGANTYTWTGGSNANTYSVSPTSSTIYTVAGTNTTTTCSNTAIQSVTVKPTLFSSQTVTVCAGGNVTVGSTVHSASGTYTDVLIGSNGCDSTVTTNLTVRTNITYTQSPVICYGYSYSVGTHSYTASGTYTDVLLSSSTGCDSTVTTNLTVRPNITYTQSPVICYGYSYSVGPNTYTASGTYTDVLLSSSTGCDSTVTTNLTVRPNITYTQSPVICYGYSYSVGPNTYTASGTYTDVLLSSSTGCDSTVITNLTVRPNITYTQSPIICYGYSYSVGTHSYTASGTYTDVLLSSSTGCDSTVTTNLTVRPNITYTQSPVICYGYSYSVGPNTYTASGTYTDVLLSSSTGCDSTVITNLTVRPNITYTQSPVVCYGYSYSVGTHSYTASGTYTDVLLSSSTGCDSTVTTNLTVRPNITYTQSPVICYGYSYSVGPNTYTASGTYINTLTAISGCDSTIIINLTVRPIITSIQSFSICTGQSIHIGSSSYSSTGTYTNVLTSYTGCDSIVTTNLQVDLMPTLAHAGYDTTVYNSSMLLGGNIPVIGTGIWSVVSGSADFSNNTSANTEISDLENGQTTLQWTISNGVCPVSRDEVTISVRSLAVPNGFSPNGDGVNDVFDIPGLDEFSNIKLEVFNRWGSTVYNSSNYKNNWNGKNMSGEDLSDDTYFFILEIPDKKRYEGYVVLKRK